MWVQKEREGNSMLRPLSIFVVVATMISGCVSIKHIPIEQSAISKIKGKEVIVVKRPIPNFAAMTPGKAAFGGIGLAFMVSAGNSLIQENGISDPAYEIAEELARSMEAKYGTKYAGIGSNIISDDEVASVVAAYKTVPLALDVKTLRWDFIYFPTSWSKYRVHYYARLRLIDTSMSNVIAEGDCSSITPEKTDDAPTYDELVGNGAIRLVAELKKAARYCVQEFSSKYLGMQ
jgi:hypothetical protein